MRIRVPRFGAFGSSVFAFLLIAAGSTTATELKEATVTQIFKQVDLLPNGAASRAASLKDNVRDGTAVRTGSESRSELTFTDQTLARLGANTIFSFDEGTRNLDLAGGAMLLRVPKGAGGARISTAAVTAAVTGTTVIMEYHPGKKIESQTASAGGKSHGIAFGLFERKSKKPATQGGYVKFITLEGVARVYLNNRVGESVLVPAGQMLIMSPDAKHIADPVDVDLARLLKTSLLITEFPPLASLQLIAQEAEKQKEKKAQGKLYDTNLVIYGSGTVVVLKDPPPLDSIDQAIAAIGLPIGAGGEVGPLSTITTPSPYFLNGSTIKTAPTITSGGVTNQGKLYRGTIDGQPSQYFFGSTSAFDTSSGFNASVLQPANLPIAAFKFSQLILNGDPTIIIPSGGAHDLALISESSLGGEGPGGPLSFTGMNSVLLATQSGGIFLAPVISFAEINKLTIYARGASTSLNLATQTMDVGTLSLFSEGTIDITDDQNLSVVTATPFNGGTLNAIAGGDITLQSVDINATSGIIGTNDPPGGAGGRVSLTSQNGGITINDTRIKVSSADAPGTANRRSSASGGTINIESDRSDNIAINISNSSQLLSLLDAAAPGPGGLITIKATGTMSSVFVGGQIEADRGGIDIRHTGDLGTITLNSVTARGDIIKIAALGTTGVLTIGNSVLNADSVLKLYAPSSSGTIRFVADCTIGAKVANIIAAGTVIISPSVTVTVTGKPVDVYVNFDASGPVGAQYSGWGGANPTNGTFAGLGATNPQPLANAPLLGSPGGP